VDASEWTIAGLGAALRAGATTSVEVVRRLLARADVHDPVLGVYLSRFDDAALAAASGADAELAAGRDRGPLHGIPLGIKDLIATREGPTTAQSVVDHRWHAVRADAPVITRLRAAGAVLLGKVATMEFGVGGPVGQPSFRVPRNPWHSGHWTGGSSSGTGSGIAAGLFPAGLGTDTAGSIRGPAAYCGVSGLKPTFGLVPVSGCVPLAPSYDTVGPMARTAEDCASLLDALTGGDHHAGLTGSLSGVTVGVDPLDGRGETADPATPAALAAAVDVLRAAGAAVRRVDVPWYEELTTATVLGFVTEGFAEHRLDLRRQWGTYGPQTRRALATGALVPGGDYVQMQRVRETGRDAMADLFTGVDLVVTPTAAGAAPAVADLPVRRTIDALYTPAWNATGNPALSVPMGFTGAGLPLGLQIIGRHHQETAVLDVGHAFQLRTDWHLRVPAPAITAAPGPDLVPDRVRDAAPDGAVLALLDVAGLAPTTADVHALAARHADVPARIDALYRVTTSELPT
jgi:aspartyl-tRNA(Asn)/glutamyl-tRNA(Gln) amidotransferase subunit A